MGRIIGAELILATIMMSALYLGLISVETVIFLLIVATAWWIFVGPAIKS